MNKKTTITDSILIVLIIFVSGSQAVSQKQTKPNILFVLADDLGWRDVGFNGSQYYETPHLDALSQKSIIFTHAYANAANCAPTRASILTGQYTPRHGILTVNQSDRGDKQAQKLVPIPNTTALDTATFSLAEAIKVQGYHTAFIGKWHIGDHKQLSPLAHGFDYSLGAWERGSPASYFSPYKNPALADGPTGEHLTDRLTREAIDYLKIRQDSQPPFFLYLSYYAVHSPIEAPDTLVARFARKNTVDKQTNATYAAMLANFDSNVGRLLDHLEQSGLADNTWVIFYSDNGGSWRATDNSPLKGAKGTLYEGGIRVPCLVYDPNHPTRSSRVDTPIISTDLFPTFLEIAGSSVPSVPLDGESILPLLSGATRRNPALFWYAPVYLPGGSYSGQQFAFRGTPSSAIRKGDYKLIWYYAEEKGELYHLSGDPSESDNLASSHPSIYDSLQQELTNWHQNIGAEVPNKPNPAYDSLYTQQTYSSTRFQ